ncbi:unnamed protein product [Rodentolepis nana]|uniref:IQ domain-containing protein H n=1 Tax=Rodentolepis nana TaxID=102285 RepID=A0A0R3TS83_RODNA|nr:unnamed protein product [Rodentolepis nana]
MGSSNEDCFQCKILSQILQETMESVKALNCRVADLKTQLLTLQSQIHQDVMSVEYDIGSLRAELDKKNVENEDLRTQLQEVLTRNGWYGECNHSCSKHPRSYPHLSVHGHQGEVIAEGDPCPPCDICTEAEAWAQGLMDTAPKFSDSLRKNFQSTLPLRLRPPLYQVSSSTPFSTMKKSASDSPKGKRGEPSVMELAYKPR